MDPTKSFDHLDPKLKETYARVMGTSINGSVDSAQNTPAQTDPSLSATPAGLSPSQNSADQTPNTGPNPGTGPTITAMPTDAPSMFSATPNESPIDNTAPATSSFFSNPSPATTEPIAPVVDTPPASVPVVPAPFTPEGYSVNPSAGAETFSQPLPSPATVNNAATHEASPLLKVLYIVGAIVFFAIYTIFWIKVFGLPIPFLNF